MKCIFCDGIGKLDDVIQCYHCDGTGEWEEYDGEGG